MYRRLPTIFFRPSIPCLMLFPETTKKSNKAINPIEPWMSQGIMVSRKRKNLLASLSLKNPTRVSVAEFRAFRNLYNQVIRSAKKIYFQKQLADNQKNLRKTWQILFSTINKNTKFSSDRRGERTFPPHCSSCHCQPPPPTKG